MQAFYYLSNTPNDQFFSGIWDQYGNYKTIDDILYGTTSAPTFQPTVQPTFQPTLQPTFKPTNDPTYGPTKDPTNDPTTEPTMEPTVEPTNQPTIEPTVYDPGNDKEQNLFDEVNMIILIGVALLIGFIVLALVGFIVYKKRKFRRNTNAED